jgi:GT2 family glycosyltransferase
MSRPAVTIGILNYNGGRLVEECVRSALDQNYDPAAVLVVDNGSTDDSPRRLRRIFPGIRLKAFEDNLGPPAVRNWIIGHAQTPLIFCMDNDVILAPDCLTRLIRTLTRESRTAVCGPRVMDYHRRDWMQLGITYIHYTAAVVVRRDPVDEPVEVGSVGGGAVLIDRKTALQTGLYDEDYFFGLEDNDFCTRLRLAGYRCLHVPDARIYHRAKNRGLWAAAYQIRNRWYFLLKFYRWRTLLVLSPALLIYELSTLLFLASRRRLKDYLAALGALRRHLPAVLEKRSRIQSQRVLEDRQLVVSGEIYLRPEMTVRRHVRWARRLQSGFFGLYWNLARRLI